MFDFSLHEFRSAFDVITYWEGHYEKGPPKTGDSNAFLAAAITGIAPAIPAEEINIQKRLIGLLTATCRRLESEAGADRIARIEQSHKYPTLLTYPKAYQEWKALREALEDDVKRRYVVYVPRECANLYLNMGADWAVPSRKFKGIDIDLGSALQCYALNQPTASIFHLMRAMEIVVKALARKLGMSISPQTTWRQLTGSMNVKISGMPENTDYKKRRKNAWSDAAAHLHTVGQAWRNTTMHPAKSYSMAEARAVLDATRAFMIGATAL